MNYGATGSGTTDDTAAINEALSAANTAKGGVVYFPAGTYLISSALVGATGVRLTGDHRSVSTIVSTSSSVLAMGGSFIVGMEIDHLTLEVAGADLITGCDLKALHLHDCQLIQNSAAYAIWNGTSGSLMIECVFQRNLESVAGATRSIAAWYFSGGGGINANVWRDNVCTNTGADATQYWFEVIASANGATNEGNTWDNITFENPLGGMINLQSATRCRIQMCLAWDASATIAKTLIAIQGNAGGGVCTDTLIIGSPRASSGFVMGTGVYDISVDAATTHTTIIHPTKNALINLGGSTAATILGAPAFMAVSGATPTAVYGAGADNGASTPTVTAGPDNHSGQVTFTTGSAPTTGSQVKLTFGTPFAVTPTVMITPGSGQTAGLLCAVESVSATGFSLYAGGTPAPDTSYNFYWQATD